MEYICVQCGCKFNAKKGAKRKFCSRDCYNAFYKEHGYYWNKKDRVEVKCLTCGKTEFVTKSRARKYKFCSKKCESISRTKSLEERDFVIKICPTCGKEFIVKKSSEARRICCSKKCDFERRIAIKMYNGENNPNYKGFVIENGVKRKSYERYKDGHQRIVFDYFGIKIPPTYHIHHKDANPSNNDYCNLVILPKETHMLIHRWFGNILLNAVSNKKITRELFFSLCTNEQAELYKNIIDLNITNQAVVKQGELLENSEVDNQQPSVYRNIYVGSTTNSRDLTDNAEVGNADTSALPFDNESEDIV